MCDLEIKKKDKHRDFPDIFIEKRKIMQKLNIMKITMKLQIL